MGGTVGDLGGAAGPGGAVLVVDDDADIREQFAMVLESHGLHVFHAADGVQALRAIASGPPAAVVLDLGIPKVDGFQVLAALSQHPVTRRLPLVVVSGVYIDATAIHRVLDGFDRARFVAKPCSVYEVTAWIASLLTGPPEPAPPPAAPREPPGPRPGRPPTQLAPVVRPEERGAAAAPPVVGGRAAPSRSRRRSASPYRGPERRRRSRVPMQGEAILHLPGGTFRARIEEGSETGLGVLANATTPLSGGERVRVELRFDDLPQLVLRVLAVARRTGRVEGEEGLIEVGLSIETFGANKQDYEGLLAACRDRSAAAATADDKWVG